MIDDFGIPHAMLLMLDAAGRAPVHGGQPRLRAFGCRVGDRVGEGVIGVAARMNTPIRINHATLEYAIRARHASMPSAACCSNDEIPLPGLAAPGSQLAVPLATGGQVLGVLFVESPGEMQLTWDDEDALVSLAAQVAALARGFQACSDHGDRSDEGAVATAVAHAPAAPVQARCGCATSTPTAASFWTTIT